MCFRVCVCALVCVCVCVDITRCFALFCWQQFNRVRDAYEMMLRQESLRGVAYSHVVRFVKMKMKIKNKEKK